LPGIRSTVLLSAAVLLGVLGGAGTGYAVQSGRPPTPLPPLAGAQPKYPAAHGRSAEPLPVAQDDMTRTDGDLGKLILQPPKGTQRVDLGPGSNGWMTAAQYADAYGRRGGGKQQRREGFRRAVDRSWTEGLTVYSVDLVQYRHDSEDSVYGELNGAQGGAADWAGGDSYRTQLPGTQNEAVYAGHRQEGSDGFSVYTSAALGRHGDILVIITETGPKPASVSSLEHLLAEQLERL
jgi:hypothetical protein